VYIDLKRVKGLNMENENQENGIVVFKNNIQSGLDYYGDTSSDIESIYNNISSLLPDSQKLQDYINRKIALDRLASNVNKDDEVSKINLKKNIEYFFSIYTSRDTVKNYVASINGFQKYCDEKGLAFVKVDIKDAQIYLKELNSNFASRTVRYISQV